MSAHVHRRTLLAGATAAIALTTAVAAQPRRGGTLRVSVEQAPVKLSPLQQRVTPEYLLGELLYSGLTRLGPNMAAEPDLALSWSADAGLVDWTFKLRPGVTFHDGTALTAKDVVATLRAVLDPATGSPGRSNIGPIDTIDAPDDLTVHIHLKGPYADLPVALAYTNAKIVPAAILAANPARLDREAVGTGPFKLVSYEPSRLTVLERNPAYYRPDRHLLDRIEVVLYPDPTARASAQIAGDTDLMINVDPASYARLDSAAGTKAMRTPSGQFLNVIMGCTQKPFDDIRVRKALALTIDRPALVDLVAEGLGTVGADVPANAAYRFYDPLPAKEADIAEAKRLLAAAGHGGGLDVTLIASDRPGTRTQLGVALREMAKPAGFNITVQTMAHATFLDQAWLKAPFYVGYYNMQATIDAVFSLLYTADAPWNESKWNNAAFDTLIATARRTADDAQRKQLYDQAQKLMYDEVPTLIPTFFDVLAARGEYVQGFTLHPRGTVFRLEDVSVGPRKG
jgi:peptide/nickel transport system substrate-binding protein